MLLLLLPNRHVIRCLPNVTQVMIRLDKRKWGRGMACKDNVEGFTGVLKSKQKCAVCGSRADLPVQGSVSSIGTALKSNAFQLPLSFFGFMRGPCERRAPAAAAAGTVNGAAAVTSLLQASQMRCRQDAGTRIHCVPATSAV